MALPVKTSPDYVVKKRRDIIMPKYFKMATLRLIQLNIITYIFTFDFDNTDIYPFIAICAQIFYEMG